MIIPSIDLINGSIVRLYQGKYHLKKNYTENVFDVLLDYFQQGANIVHVVDLDGALDPVNKQTQLIRKLLVNTDFNLQVGGGIRNRKDIETLLEYGVKRIVIGSAVVNSNSEVKEWFKEYGSEIFVLALDLKINKHGHKEVVCNAWKDSTGLKFEDVINKFILQKLKYVLCTDISKDGTLFGPNISLYKEISSVFKFINFQSSGGIGSIKDIKAIKQSGIQDVIIGRALLEKKFSLSEAIACWQKE